MQERIEPQPTVCVTVIERDGRVWDDCFVRPTPIPEKYYNLGGNVLYQYIEAEQKEKDRVARGEGRTADADMQEVFVLVTLESDSDGNAARQWFEDNDLEYSMTPEPHNNITGTVPLLKPLELAQATGVESVGTVFGFPIQ